MKRVESFYRHDRRRSAAKLHEAVAYAIAYYKGLVQELEKVVQNYASALDKQDQEIKQLRSKLDQYEMFLVPGQNVDLDLELDLIKDRPLMSEDWTQSIDDAKDEFDQMVGDYTDELNSEDPDDTSSDDGSGDDGSTDDGSGDE